MNEIEAQNSEPSEQNKKDYSAFNAVMVAIQTLRESKPNDRSELDRRYAVAITEMEKVMPYVLVMIAQRKGINKL